MAQENMNALRDEVLKEYKQLAYNIDQMNTVIVSMNTEQVPLLTDKLREIERKFGLVYTLFKASVYAIVKDDERQNPSVMNTAINAYDPTNMTNRPAFLLAMSATTITAILDSNNVTSSNSELLDRVSSAFAQFDTACQNVEKSISSLSHATSSSSTTYQQDRQGSLQALNHLDVISQWLDIPQTIHQCITNEHWDDVLALWDRCRYWQQSQASTTMQDDQINRVMLIRQIYEQVDHTVQTELAQQLIIHLASDTSLPDLARFLGRLRRVWSDTTMSITDSIARPISLSERLAALLIKARLRWWYQASNESMIDDSMITTSKLDASSLTTEQHLTALSQYLDIVRTTLPDIHRQWQVLLASTSTSSRSSSINESKEGNKKKQKKQKKKQEKEKKADEDDKDNKDDQMIMTNAAANYLTKQLVNCIQRCLDTIHDITSLVKLESILTHSASSLGRYGSDPLTWMLPNLHEKCLHITRVRIQRINDDCRKEMEQNVDWITAITTSQRAIDTLALPNEPIPVDVMNWPPTALLQIPIWARLFNMYMALFNDLRWYAPINIGLAVAESMRDMLQQTAINMSTILHRYCKESASSTNDNDEEDKRQHHHYASTITRYYIYLLVPMLWHALLHQVFGRSTTSHDDNTIVSIDNIESVSIQELKDILKEWINS
ncbi:DASH complex subunit Dad3-domain-containing protein [Syncephalis plumigaleata]|nr:DASH complex subunit Dad3-domain-containing protein [Syncephalis plumigaleata]